MDNSTQLKQGALLHHDSTYRVIRVLGQGGFGITYLVEHVRLKKLFAIKEFFPETLCDRESTTGQMTTSSANAKLVDRLRRKFVKEAEHIAKMDSPYIVKVIDVFEENNTAYYIMDYIEGRSLSEMVKSEGPMAPDRAIGYITKIGQALSTIHAKRVNHLDVKPGNIMVRKSDDTPLLIDFGLSKQYDSDGKQTSTMAPGFSHGFAPVEQYKEGGVSEFSPQTDLYSLAATLYYLLTGVVPPHAASMVEEDLEFPAYFPPGLIAVIRQGMSLKRSHRQESIAEFCRQLNVVGNGADATQFMPNNVGSERRTEFRRIDKNTSANRLEQLRSMSDKERKKIISSNLKKVAFYILVCIVLVFCLWGLKRCDSKKEPQPISVTGTSAPVTQTADATGMTVEPEEEVLAAEVDENYGAPLSEGEKPKVDGRFDDNAEGYFQQWADGYITQHGDVNYKGYFSDSKGRYPIALKFKLDDNYFPGVCYYYNIDYNVKLKMSVRFTEEQMIISGNAGGSNFNIMLSPTYDGKWSGIARNGNHQLNANIELDENYRTY